jgi:hypothetical protein
MKQVHPRQYVADAYKLGVYVVDKRELQRVPVNSATLEHCLPCTVLVSLLRQCNSRAGTLVQVGNGCCHVRLCNRQANNHQTNKRANKTAAAL